MIAGRVAAAPGYTQRRVETHEQVGRDGMEGACNTLYPPVHPPSRARARDMEVEVDFWYLYHG